MVFYRCGHKACCESCSKAFRSGNCPICRAKIEDCIQEYDAWKNCCYYDIYKAHNDSNLLAVFSSSHLINDLSEYYPNFS